MDTVLEKPCAKCGQEARGPGYTTCRACHAAYMAAYYRRTRERWRQRVKARLAQKSAKSKAATYERQHRWYVENRNRVLARENARRRANPDTDRRHGRKRDARRAAGSAVERIDWKAIRERDAGRCWLCGEAIRSEADLEMDHAIPLSRGGEHSTRNIRMSHRACNRKKYASEVTHQIVLF